MPCPSLSLPSLVRALNSIIVFKCFSVQFPMSLAVSVVCFHFQLDILSQSASLIVPLMCIQTPSYSVHTPSCCWFTFSYALVLLFLCKPSYLFSLLVPGCPVTICPFGPRLPWRAYLPGWLLPIQPPTCLVDSYQSGFLTALRFPALPTLCWTLW